MFLPLSTVLDEYAPSAGKHQALQSLRGKRPENVGSKYLHPPGNLLHVSRWRLPVRSTRTLPERPGALFNFLNKLGGRWNISMFHYRNHGAAYGRVVAGLQVPASERHLLPAALDGIGYQYWDETDNPAYRLYLG